MSLNHLQAKTTAVRKLWRRLFSDNQGQDMIEYALMAAAVAVGSAAVLPSATDSIRSVFSKVTSVLIVAAG